MTNPESITHRQYASVHRWIKSYYGKADRCENPKCEGKSAHFEWALLKGKEYGRERSSFWMLCKSCHVHYDLTTEQRIAQSASIRSSPRWRHAIHRRKLPLGRSGLRGAQWDASNNKWRASIKYKGRACLLGLFDDPNDAALVFSVAAQILFPGRPCNPTI